MILHNICNSRQVLAACRPQRRERGKKGGRQVDISDHAGWGWGYFCSDS